ncbi:MAG: TatD family hydrolase [Clostridia bacterium]|nr:TatD family hydrolase [Clostridia bacterium]
MKLFDSHAHCDDQRIENEFEGGCRAYIKHQLQNGVGNIVNIGTNLENSQVSVALSQEFEELYAAVGIHPSDTRFYEDVDDTLDKIEKMLSLPKVVALGEIGLDYHYEDTDKEKQILFFEKQMELAKKLDVPVIIHDRDAHGDCMEIIKKHPEVKGIFHSFSGSAEMARELVKMGWYISFSGTVTYKNAQKPKEACVCVPDDRILIETDSPYLPPVPHRGELNHPCYVALTCAKIAELRGISYEKAVNMTAENARRVFRLS